MSMSGSSSIRRLKECPVVIGLREFSPVGRRATGGRDWRRLERFAQVREGLTSRGRSHPGNLVRHSDCRPVGQASRLLL